MCPRIPQDHLDEMLDKMGEAVFEQEYFCRFLLGDRQVFSVGAIDSIGQVRKNEKRRWAEAVRRGRLRVAMEMIA